MHIQKKKQVTLTFIIHFGAFLLVFHSGSLKRVYVSVTVGIIVCVCEVKQREIERESERDRERELAVC